MSTQFTYNKTERLKSRKQIARLFQSGNSASSFPLKALFLLVDDIDAPLQAGVTVSSRSFKKAVDRNRVKRVMREAYRLHKLPVQQLMEQSGKHLIIFFIYTGKELPVYAEVEKKMQVILQRIADQIAAAKNHS